MDYITIFSCVIAGLLHMSTAQFGNETGTSSPGTPSQFCTEGQVLPFDYVQVSPSTVRMLPVLCLNGILGSICSVGFDDQDASVVCNALGVTLNRTALGGRAFNNIFNFTLGPVLLQDLYCTGYETNLQQCQFQTNVSTLCMNDRSYTAGVECYFEATDPGSGSGVFPVVCENGQVRGQDFVVEVTGSQLVVSAFLEICYNGQFGGICNRYIGGAAPIAACNEFPYGTAISGELVFENRLYTGNIVAGSVYCTMNESSTHCEANFTVPQECSNSFYATRVRCYYSYRTGRAQMIAPKLYDSCPSDTSGFQEEVLQILSSEFGVSLLGLSRQHPAQSCHQIGDANPSSLSGLYWIGAEANIQQQHCTF